MSTLRTVYARALSDASIEISAEMEAAVVAYAASSKDPSLLELLAGRPHITDATRAVLRRSPQVHVKAAWLTRPDLPLSELTAALAKEKRATVLAAVAAHENATPEVLEALSQDGRTSVLSALLGNPRLSDDDAVRAIASLADGRVLNHPDNTVLRAAVAERRDSASVLVHLISSPDVLTLVIGARLDHSASEALLEKLITRPLAEIAANSATRMVWSTTQARTRVLERGLKLLEAGTLDLDLAIRLASTISTEAATSGTTLTPAQAKVLTSLTGDPEAVSEALAELEATRARIESARTVTDPLAIEALVEQVGTLPQTYRRDDPLPNALADNPALTPTQVARVMPHVPLRRADLLTRRTATTHRDHEDLPVLLATALTHSGLSLSDVTALAPDLEALQRAVLARATAHGSQNLFASLLTSPDLLTAVLLDTPWTAVDHARPAPVVALLTERLTSPAAWETFQVLSSQFDGTLGALLDASAALA